MPYPNEHACRLRDPADFEADSFRRVMRTSGGRPLTLIIGRLRGKTTTTPQAFRYPKSAWEPDAARKHCTEHGGTTFEPASSAAALRGEPYRATIPAVDHARERILQGAVVDVPCEIECNELAGMARDGQHHLIFLGTDVCDGVRGYGFPVCTRTANGSLVVSLPLLLEARRGAAHLGQTEMYHAAQSLIETMAARSGATPDAPERRCYATSEVAIRAEPPADGKGRLSGYAAVFGTMSEPMGFSGWRETISPGAFTRTLEDKDDVIANINHEGGLETLARTTSGTLRLTQDARGLRADIDLPDTTAGRDTLELVKRGDLSKMSFAFRVRKQEWNEEESVRTLLDVRLYDVSVVNWPAYEDTAVQTASRRAADAIRRWADIEAEGARLRALLSKRSIAVRQETCWKPPNVV